MDARRGFAGLIGYRVVARQGTLGRVVGADDDDGAESSTILVRGGVSDSLVYHVPATRVADISHDAETVHADVDVSDFLPTFGDGGTVILRLA
jgi:hypothetical protein